MMKTMRLCLVLRKYLRREKKIQRKMNFSYMVSLWKIQKKIKIIKIS